METYEAPFILVCVSIRTCINLRKKTLLSAAFMIQAASNSNTEILLESIGSDVRILRPELVLEFTLVKELVSLRVSLWNS